MFGRHWSPAAFPRERSMYSIDITNGTHGNEWEVLFLLIMLSINGRDTRNVEETELEVAHYRNRTKVLEDVITTLDFGSVRWCTPDKIDYRASMDAPTKCVVEGKDMGMGYCWNSSSECAPCKRKYSCTYFWWKLLWYLHQIYVNELYKGLMATSEQRWGGEKLSDEIKIVNSHDQPYLSTLVECQVSWSLLNL